MKLVLTSIALLVSTTAHAAFLCNGHGGSKLNSSTLMILESSNHATVLETSRIHDLTTRDVSFDSFRNISLPGGFVDNEYSEQSITHFYSLEIQPNHCVERLSLVIRKPVGMTESKTFSGEYILLSDSSPGSGCGGNESGRLECTVF